MYIVINISNHAKGAYIVKVYIVKNPLAPTEFNKAEFNEAEFNEAPNQAIPNQATRASEDRAQRWCDGAPHDLSSGLSACLSPRSVPASFSDFD